jgi:hypothetical protein
LTGIIIFFLLTGTSIALDYWHVAIFTGFTISIPFIQSPPSISIPPVPPAILSGIGLILFAIFMGWALLDKSIFAKKLETSKPYIEASVLYDLLTGLYIDVKNKGETANFMAQVNILDSTDDIIEWRQSPYDAYWDDEPTSKVSIARGLSHRIRLTSFEQHNGSGWLRLYKSTAKGMQYYDTIGYLIDAPYPQYGEIPQVYLSVCISSEPGASNGAVYKTLRIKANFEFEEEDTGK